MGAPPGDSTRAGRTGGEMADTLIRRNVSIHGHRTSLRLEGEIWAALEEICRLEGLSSHQLCALIDNRWRSANRTSAIRAFIVGYFRAAATPEGHRLAGHGQLGKSASSPD